MSSPKAINKVLKVANTYYELAKQQDVLCTASVDEVMRFLRAASELADQGIDDEDIYLFLLKTSLVKLPECERYYEEAIKKVGLKGVG